MRMSQRDLPNKSGRVINRTELRIGAGFPQISCTPPACSDCDQPISHRNNTGTTIVLEAAHAQPEISRWFPHRRHDDFHLPQPWGEFAHIACSCPCSRPLIIFSLRDVTRLFLAISSSVRSKTSNAVALSNRDSPGEIVIDCTPHEMLSIVFLSANPFKFLSRLNVPAVNVFVRRSAQLSCDFTVLNVSVFALTNCCNHNVLPTI